MKTRNLIILTVVVIIMFSTNLCAENSDKGEGKLILSFNNNPVTKKVQNQYEMKGFFFTVPELYFGSEKKENQHKILYSVSTQGSYNFPNFGAIALKAGSYKSANNNMLASEKSTTRIMLGYDSGIVSIMTGMDFNEATNTEKNFNTPVIEARFIWPILLYEEFLAISQPKENNLLLKNRLGIGLIVLEAGWEWEIISIDEKTETRNGAFVGVFHVLTFSVSKDYFYGGLRFRI